MAQAKLMTVVIADAGPLIALSRIGKLNLLQQLFQQVSITTLVRDEIPDTFPGFDKVYF